MQTTIYGELYWCYQDSLQIPDGYKLVFFCMWNHCSPIFHFNWFYRVRRPQLNYLYQQKTSLTYWTFSLHRLTFSTTVNTTKWVAWNSHGVACVCCCRRNCDATRKEPRPCNLPTNDTALVTLRWRHTTVVHKDEIDALHDRRFNKEIGENENLPFLDCLVSRDNSELRTTVHRKPTHTDRSLDESSYNPNSDKATNYKNFDERWAQLVCDTPNSLRDENKYLKSFFPQEQTTLTLIIKRNIYRPSEADATNRNPTPVTTVTIP